ncbi:D-glycero-D-manno-heptose 1,7-bisphosphate phosphatase [Prosthecobacter fusiformis]|uniref:D,D-heptose 1,7-bisphosphate phosphatase n=1 Tax=Prosthecobacter fusiformis TaxID=48464 RepID=A0A4R7STP6_9BACT|nr:HAD-IIIA family hydrolase [Prosthecobacter fusiformis]TDU81628.1 D-glycero-D-manno-heptose 1,7-bisphosphate phosphatase [Prosthecobacter fusiformis]
MSRPAVFFDRDGVVNLSPGAGYVLTWDDFHFSPGIIEALKICHTRGYATILATSQQGVGKGLMSQSTLDDIHARMQAELEKHAAAFDGIYACTCLSSDPACTCRKPSAEMLLRAAREHDLDLTRSLMVGDADRDIQMGTNAGIPLTIRIESENPHLVSATHTLPDTTGLAALLERCLAETAEEVE